MKRAKNWWLGLETTGLMDAERFIAFAAKEPYNLTLTLDKARSLKKNWERTWPESKRYSND